MITMRSWPAECKPDYRYRSELTALCRWKSGFECHTDWNIGYIPSVGCALQNT